MQRIHAVLFPRERDGGSERGVAMLTAILFMVIMAGAATVILGVVLAQSTPTYVAQKSTKTINSAEGGLQSALAIIRTATTVTNINGVPTTVGDPAQLPCSFPSTSVNGTASDPTTYSVTIAYYDVDPTGQNVTAGSSFNSAHLLTCSEVHGGTVPLFALLTASGQTTTIPGSTAATGARGLAAIYSFEISNINIPGGIIWNSNSTSCMQADTATAGSTITFVAAASCGLAAGASRQKWSYTTDWQLALASTTANGAAGLCITGPTIANGATQNALLQPCKASTDPARWNQLWSWTGNYTWEGELSNISGPNNQAWLSAGVADGTSAVNKKLQVVKGSSVGTLTPTSLVGAGAASYETHQLVNYQEFGRCADVTNEVLPNNPNHLISYPCKQDPTGGTTNISWNHKWYYCEPSDIGHTGNCSGHLPNGASITAAAQQIYVYKNDDASQKYCLTTPTGSATQTGFTSFQTCATSGTTLTSQLWSRVNDPANVAYLNDYLLTDRYGRCLEVNESIAPFATNIYYQDVAPCNQSDLQKWNAPATNTTSTVGGYKEVAGG